MKSKSIIAFASALCLISSMSVIDASAGGDGSYLTVEGDSWSLVADKVGVDVDTLMSANGGSYDSPLQIGVYLTVPWNYQPDPETVTNSWSYEDWEDTFNYNEFVNEDYDKLGFESPDYGYIYNGMYFPAPYEGWYSVAEHSGYSLDSLLLANGATIDTPLIYGSAVLLPAEASFDSSNWEAPNNSYIEGEEVEEQLASVTLYNNPNLASWHNIVRGAELLDGLEASRGEEVSFYNQFPNQGGEADGMIESNYYIDKDTVGQTFGGGLCFDGTAFYQVNKAAGNECLERHDHVQSVQYATVGVNDAAVNLTVDPDSRQDVRFLVTAADRVRYHFYVDNVIGSLTATISKLTKIIN